MSDKSIKEDNKHKKDSQLLDKLTHLETEIQQLTEALKRERADSINLARIHATDIEKARDKATVAVVKQLLPAIDSLERALQYLPTEEQNSDFMKGLESVVKQFAKAFNNLGVSRIEAVNQDFDPNLHEAVHYDESGSGNRQIVSEELQAGYTINGQIIRPAMVNVKSV